MNCQASDSNAIQCAISTKKHLIIDPILLSCGHYMCKACMILLKKENVVCKICGERSELFDRPCLLEEQFCSCLNNLKESFKNLMNRVETQVEYLTDEIDIRIESIKTELDKFGEQLKLELNENRKHFDRFTQTIDLNSFEEDLLRLKTRNKWKQYDESINSLAEKQRKMEKLIHELNAYSIPITYEVSKKEIELELIGRTKPNLTTNSKINLLNESIMNGKYTSININTHVTDIGILSDEHFLTANYDQSNLTLFNKKFQLIKTITKLDNKPINPLCVAVNQIKKEVSITDLTLHKVYITDFDFNILHTIGCGLRGFENNQFQYPFGVAYDNSNFLHVCDKGNKRLQVFNSNYELSRSIQFDYEPYYVKILNNTVCVAGYANLYFYDLPTFKLKFHYSNHYGSVCVLLSKYFIEYDFEKGKLFYFDESGFLVNENSSNLFKKNKNKLIDSDDANNEADILRDNSWECLAYFNEKLVISSEKNKKFFLI